MRWDKVMGDKTGMDGSMIHPSQSCLPLLYTILIHVSIVQQTMYS